ncbi:hypothetical protein GCM10008170_01000 [Methylopila capsulata]|uniref:Uncharacterized protein n=1 Tax=Methylopila capsulata TaxID=61654 RepID=A0A9W6IS37_9HYPH|nr:hypothetical protein GCM10008170_01000 [Methylopila capsulata]
MLHIDGLIGHIKHMFNSAVEHGARVGRSRLDNGFSEFRAGRLTGRHNLCVRGACLRTPTERALPATTRCAFEKD